MWHEVDGMGWWMALMGVGFVFFWAVVFWAVVQITNRGPGSTPTPRAIDIAENRYARGEISLDELKEIRSNLSR
jgi:uncharacterized membrane protein